MLALNNIIVVKGDTDTCRIDSSLALILLAVVKLQPLFLLTRIGHNGAVAATRSTNTLSLTSLTHNDQTTEKAYSDITSETPPYR